MTEENDNQMFSLCETDWQTGVRMWRECSITFYYYCLEALPPMAHNGFAFLLGEPYSHGDDGRPVAQCCVCVGQRYFTMLMSTREFRDGKLFAALALMLREEEREPRDDGKERV